MIDFTKSQYSSVTTSQVGTKQRQNNHLRRKSRPTASASLCTPCGTTLWIKHSWTAVQKVFPFDALMEMSEYSSSAYSHTQLTIPKSELLNLFSLLTDPIRTQSSSRDYQESWASALPAMSDQKEGNFWCGYTIRCETTPEASHRR